MRPGADEAQGRARDCAVPGRRSTQRMGAVGGPPWPLPAGLLAGAAVAHVAAGLLLVTVADDLAAGRFYGPSQLAAAHLFGLAFLSVAIVGAMLQLVPVVLRQQVASTNVATAVGVTFAGGSWALAAGFLLERDVAVATGGTLVVLAGGALVALLVRVLVGAARARTLGAPGVALMASVTWLAILLAMGAIMAANFLSPFLETDRTHLIAAHAAVALLGWIGGTILAISLKLGPMFALAHGGHPRLGPIAIAVWHAGVVPLALGLLTGRSDLAAAGGVIVAVAAVLGCAFAVDVIRSRRRRIEAPLAHLVFGLAAVLAACALALRGWWLDADPVRTATAAVLLVMVGFGAGVTSGHLFKVVPMLVWTGRYAHMAGRPGAPRLADMYPASLARIEQAAFAAGAVLLVAGVMAGEAPVARAGAALLCVAAVAVAVAIAVCIAGTAHGIPTTSPHHRTAATPATGPEPDRGG